MLKLQFLAFSSHWAPLFTVTQHNLKYSLWEFDHPVWSAEIKDHLRRRETHQMTPFRCPTVEAISQLLNYDAFFSVAWYANCAICRRNLMLHLKSQTNPFILNFSFAPLRSSPDVIHSPLMKRNCISLKCTCRGERNGSTSRAACKCATCNFIFRVNSRMWTDSISFRCCCLLTYSIAVMPFPGYWELLPSNYAVRCRFLFLKDLSRPACIRKKERKKARRDSSNAIACFGFRQHVDRREIKLQFQKRHTKYLKEIAHHRQFESAHWHPVTAQHNPQSNLRKNKSFSRRFPFRLTTQSPLGFRFFFLRGECASSSINTTAYAMRSSIRNNDLMGFISFGCQQSLFFFCARSIVVVRHIIQNKKFYFLAWVDICFSIFAFCFLKGFLASNSAQIVLSWGTRKKLLFTRWKSGKWKQKERLRLIFHCESTNQQHNSEWLRLFEKLAEFFNCSFSR